jgi:hypothetical protein
VNPLPAYRLVDANRAVKRVEVPFPLSLRLWQTTQLHKSARFSVVNEVRNVNNEDFYSADFTNSLPPALKNDPDMMALAQTDFGTVADDRGGSPKEHHLRPYRRTGRSDVGRAGLRPHVDWYDYSYPIEVKRRTIRDSIQVHRRLGTKYAVEKALGAVYPGTKVEEWFEYGGDPYKFRVVIGATEAGITAGHQAAVLDRVRFYKNLRSHLEAISYQIEKRTAVKVAAVHAIGQRVEVYPYLARNMESHGGFYCGGYTQYGRKLAVFPNK